jgi:hypothetical protein
MQDIANKIVEAALGCKSTKMIQLPKIGEGAWINEALMFIKPEVFMLGDKASMEKVVQYMLDCLKKFNAKVEGICAVGGSFLGKNNVMSRHYGYINVVSNSASRTLDDGFRKKIEEAFKLGPGKYEVLGGHEFLKKYKTETPETLDKLWFEEKSVKLRSGFYVRHVKKDGVDIALVNGFHPNQLFHFTNPSHKTVLLLIHSNTSWWKLKNEMIGATFPEKAVPESMRGMLYANAKKYGFDSITIANNCVHLSAGPFEGMAEIANFFSKIIMLDVRKQQPLLLKKMGSSGINLDDALKSLDNPPIEYDGRSTDLFTATEDADSDKAISIFKDTVLKGKQ